MFLSSLRLLSEGSLCLLCLLSAPVVPRAVALVVLVQGHAPLVVVALVRISGRRGSSARHARPQVRPPPAPVCPLLSFLFTCNAVFFLDFVVLVSLFSFFIAVECALSDSLLLLAQRIHGLERAHPGGVLHQQGGLAQHQARPRVP
eukprot:1895287-Rhodomonas_salina.2